MIFRVPPLGLAMPFTAEAVSVYDQQRSLYTGLASRLGHDRFWMIPPPPGYANSFKQSTRFRIRTIDDYEPFSLRRQAEYLTYFYRGQTSPSRPNETFAGSWLDLKPAPRRQGAKTRRRLLDLAAVRVVVAPPLARLRPDAGDFLDGADLGAPVPIGSLLAYPNPHVLPRAFVTYRTAPAPEATELLALLSDPAFDPLVQSYIEGAMPHDEAPDAPDRGAPARIVEDGESSVEIEATLAADGLVVLADTYFTGWKATVDGVPAPILPTNHLFRGVPVAAGRHRVRFEYRPWRVTAGLTVSGLALVVLAALAIPRRRRSA